MAILSDVATEVLIPLTAVVGIAFSVAQWVLVSRVKLAPSPGTSTARIKDGYGDSLIEEEEGLNDHNVILRCAEIQNAIAEGEEASELAWPVACLHVFVFWKEKGAGHFWGKLATFVFDF